MRTIAALAGACALLLAPAAAAQQAGGLRVSPVLIEIPAERGIGSFRVRNDRASEAAFEVQVFAWSQETGEDVLTPTDALIAAPSVFLMPVGGEQIVRLGQPLEIRDVSRERAYRVVLRELPSGEPSASGFRVLVEMSMPVFVQPGAAEGRLALSRTRDSSGASAIAFVNSGAGHVRIGAAHAQSAIDPPRYVLAGARLTRRVERELETLTLITAGAGTPAPHAQTFELSDAPVLADLH
ncbi:MAG: molecular chaperone [Hyphomonadaceae bacterium]